jgi:hypothetical protein
MYNREEIEKLAKIFEELKLNPYFIGGSIVAVYADNINTFEQRVTRDVDVVIEVLNRGKYFLLQEQLREAGFREDSDSEVICRWKFDDILVDIMPNDEQILGFSNRWYSKGMENSIKFKLESGREINVFSFPYFIATKLEALKSRGEDLRYSKDFEDIIRLIENKEFFHKEIINTDFDLSQFIKTEFSHILNQNKYLTEAILCVLYPETNKERADRIVEKINIFLSN